MDVLLNHPKTKRNLHISGTLWEYLENEHADYINNVRQLVEKCNLEILSGGYYESLMFAISDRDKIGQVDKMNSYIKKEFSCKETKGLWLAERVWEPSIAKVLSESGIDYTQC